MRRESGHTALDYEIRPGTRLEKSKMRTDYLQNALKIIDDPNILVNVVSRRVKQLKRGNRALVESLEKLSAEDTALREIAEGKISYELATAEELAASSHTPIRDSVYQHREKTG